MHLVPVAAVYSSRGGVETKAPRAELCPLNPVWGWRPNPLPRVWGGKTEGAFEDIHRCLSRCNPPGSRAREALGALWNRPPFLPPAPRPAPQPAPGARVPIWAPGWAEGRRGTGRVTPGGRRAPRPRSAVRSAPPCSGARCPGRCGSFSAGRWAGTRDTARGRAGETRQRGDRESGYRSGKGAVAPEFLGGT